MCLRHVLPPLRRHTLVHTICVESTECLSIAFLVLRLRSVLPDCILPKDIEGSRNTILEQLFVLSFQGRVRIVDVVVHKRDRQSGGLTKFVPIGSASKFCDDGVDLVP